MRCITILGPSQSGKSTLARAIAAIEQPGEGTHCRSGVDIIRFSHLDEPWSAIDCPGAIDALPDALSALAASDAAVLCVGPDPENAVLAAPYLRAIEAADVPAVVFVNRIDEAETRIRDTVAALQDYARHALVLRQIPIREGQEVVGAVDLISERAWKYREGEASRLIEIPPSAEAREHEARAELLEDLSEIDDWLLEELIEDREPATGPLFSICSRALAETRVIPVFFGSASHGNGLRRLMKALRHEAPDVDALAERLGAGDGQGAAVSFHADHRAHVGKVVFLRALGEGVAVGQPLGGKRLGSLIALGGGGSPPVALAPGEIGGAIKSDHLSAGAVLSPDGTSPVPEWTTPPAPMLSRVLSPASERDEAKLSATLGMIAADERGLEVEQEEGTGRQLVRAQGPVHLRRLIDTLSEVFGIKVTEAPIAELYRESITRPAETHYRHRKQTGGAGQFADVKLTVKPGGRGEGFHFDQTVKGGAVPRNYIPAVEAGARDAMAKGPLGFPVLDVAVTLTDGQHHSVDSSEHAFRTAARMGVVQALAEAVPVLLQPIMRVTFHIPSVFSGALVPVVSSLRGQVLGFDRDPDARGWDAFHALVPGAVLGDLATTLRSATRGCGSFEVAFDHFEEIYGKEADRIVAQAQLEDA